MPFREIDSNEQGLVGIGIDITERCNRDCTYCFAEKSDKDMEKEVLQKIIAQGSELDFPEFYILGGEPGLRKDIFDILNYASSKFKTVILVTNADFMADEETCQMVADTGVTIAAQRHTLDNNYDMEKLLTGGNHLHTSHKAWGNIEKYFSPEKVCVQCCITKPVIESGSIFQVFRWARERRYEPVMEFTKEGRRFKRGCELDVSPQEMMKTLEEFRGIDQQEFNLSGADLLSPQAYGKTCHMQETSIHFKVNGEAIPCTGFPNLSYGNIKDFSLWHIINHSLRQAIKNPRSWVYGYCKQECKYFNLCTGGCRGSAFDIAGCYRASFYYCPHIPKGLSVSDMIPPTCNDCILEIASICHPKR